MNRPNAVYANVLKSVHLTLDAGILTVATVADFFKIKAVKKQSYMTNP